MKSFKILSTSSVCISKQEPQKNFNPSSKLLVGQYKTDEFRTLINFYLNPKIFNFKISRVDLVIYLNKTNIDSNIEAFMLNIGRNFDEFDPDIVTFDTAPKFFQEAHFSKIEATYSKNAVIINVSKLLDYWIKHKISNFGLTLLGLTQNSLIYISNALKNKPYLEIYVDEENTSCKPHNPSFNNNCIKDKTDSSANNDIVCGNFLSTNGQLLNKESVSYVKFDIENNTLRTNLTTTKDGIYILYKGLYKIDFFINCRSEPFSIVELELDNKPLALTQIEISSDSTTYFSTIINVPSDNMILKLKISTVNAILLTTGVCASLNLMKIN